MRLKKNSLLNSKNYWLSKWNKKREKDRLIDGLTLNYRCKSQIFMVTNVLILEEKTPEIKVDNLICQLIKAKKASPIVKKTQAEE